MANHSNGLVIDVVDWATANGSRVQLWTPFGNANQRWSRA
ncbi:RICIN domain-containing protein [Kitasatospora phosalacinea]|nr:RICIN domain-containing protein [Kitasatospora phosalacinea]